MPRTRVERRGPGTRLGHARMVRPAAASWASRGRRLTGKPVTESNPGLRAPARRGFALRWTCMDPTILLKSGRLTVQSPSRRPAIARHQRCPFGPFGPLHCRIRPYWIKAAPQRGAAGPASAPGSALAGPPGARRAAAAGRRRSGWRIRHTDRCGARPSSSRQRVVA
jgi:hypothetical protein